MCGHFFTGRITTDNSLSQSKQSNGEFFLVFLEINLHGIRDFHSSFPKEQFCILFMLSADTKIRQNSTYKQPQYTSALGSENINLLWPPLRQLQQTLGQESQLPRTAQVSLISNPLVSSLPLAKSVASPENKNKKLH